MIIEHSDRQERINCSNCFWDVTQEEIDAMHCNNCNKDIQEFYRGFVLPVPDPIPDPENTIL